MRNYETPTHNINQKAASLETNACKCTCTSTAMCLDESISQPKYLNYGLHINSKVIWHMFFYLLIYVGAHLWLNQRMFLENLDSVLLLGEEERGCSVNKTLRASGFKTAFGFIGSSCWEKTACHRLESTRIKASLAFGQIGKMTI